MRSVNWLWVLAMIPSCRFGYDAEPSLTGVAGGSSSASSSGAHPNASRGGTWAGGSEPLADRGGGPAWSDGGTNSGLVGGTDGIARTSNGGNGSTPNGGASADGTGTGILPSGGVAATGGGTWGGGMSGLGGGETNVGGATVLGSGGTPGAGSAGGSGVSSSSGASTAFGGSTTSSAVPIGGSVTTSVASAGGSAAPLQGGAGGTVSGGGSSGAATGGTVSGGGSSGAATGGTTTVVPSVQCSSIHKLGGVPTIDGVLEPGMATERLNMVGWRGTSSSVPPGNSLRFAVGWYDSGIYFYLEVTDPERNVAPDTSYVWHGDAIELYVDDDGSFPPAGYGFAPGTFQFILAAPGDGTTSSVRADRYLPIGVFGDWSWGSHIAVPNGVGYIIEAFVVAADLSLNRWQLRAGNKVGINIAHDISYPIGQSSTEGNRAGQGFLKVRSPLAGNPGDYPFWAPDVSCTPTLLSP